LIGGLITIAAIAGVFGTASVVYGLFSGQRQRQTYRPLNWAISDWVVLGTAGICADMFAFAVILASHTLVWSPFPRLDSPPFAPWLGLACLLLVTPAVFESRG
jgi:hypothetical protein